MGVKVSFANVPDQADFSLVPLGRYPARLEVDAYRKDQTGAFMTGVDGKPVMFTTKNGDIKWNLKWVILDGPQKGKWVTDNINFTSGGLKRVKVMYVRGGFAEGDEEDIDLEPEDLDKSCWYVEVEHPDPVREGYTPEESKYAFKAAGCMCSVCQKYDGKKVGVYARVGFAGMTLMDPKDAVKFNQAAAAVNGATGLCGECGAGKHTHKQGVNGCQCNEESHLPF